MGRVSGEAGQPGRGAPKHRGDSVRGSGRSKTVRLQFHLSERVSQRLGVHCSLVARDRSGVVEEVLSSWLARFGKGRELFGPVEMDDRLDIEPEVS